MMTKENVVWSDGILVRLILVMVMSCLGSVLSDASVVKTNKTQNGWQLLVDDKPYFIKGMCYFPDFIGESSSDGSNSRRNWEMVDDDKDGRNDFGYQTWVDANRNNKRDSNEPEIGDFQLMKEMGVNTIRVYHHVSDDPKLMELNKAASNIQNYPHAKEKEILRKLYEDFGIRAVMGDFLGAYTVATGASWEEGTDYTNPIQRANMLKSVEDMVKNYKDEPYILMWVLGNENNLPYPHTNASQKPEEYAKFLNEAAGLIKKIDNGRHPVAVCNGGGDVMIKYYAKHAPNVDVLGINDYSANGFDSLLKRVYRDWDRPVMFTEFGTGYPKVVDGVLDEDNQAKVHKISWQGIVDHREGQLAPQNAIGGFVFSWNDNWWEDGDKWHQNLNPNGSGWNHEYNGMASFGDGSAGSLIRQIRKIYSVYQDMWSKN